MNPASCLRTAFPGWLIASLCLGLAAQPIQAEEIAGDDPDAEILTRGPVHEAFANVVSFRPEPGIIVAKAPPELIEELPPEERPEGDNVVWIPGYWAWDDERSDYLWISGVWRALPPGRSWVAGYWNDTGHGFQWISGYWADAAQAEVRYLPPPPVSLENGPTSPAPSVDFGWTPGCWIWQSDRYAWRPGYWREERVDWVWIPASYSWTPRGYIFCDGYWDFPVVHRGVLFAPVYYRTHRPAWRGYYSPRIVISLSLFNDHLFLRPNYCHYYFGDYYDWRYERSGFYTTFSYQSRRIGYDPCYAYARWEHRDDRDWDRRHRESYRYRRDNPAARPPQVWSRERDGRTATIASRTNRTIASPLQQVVNRQEPGRGFQRVDQSDRQEWARRGREVQRTRTERRNVETQARVDLRSAGTPAGGATLAPAPSSPFSSRRFQASWAEPRTLQPANVQPRADGRGGSGNQGRDNRDRRRFNPPVSSAEPQALGQGFAPSAPLAAANEPTVPSQAPEAGRRERPRNHRPAQPDSQQEQLQSQQAWTERQNREQQAQNHARQAWTERQTQEQQAQHQGRQAWAQRHTAGEQQPDQLQAEQARMQRQARQQQAQLQAQLEYAQRQAASQQQQAQADIQRQQEHARERARAAQPDSQPDQNQGQQAGMQRQARQQQAQLQAQLEQAQRQAASDQQRAQADIQRQQEQAREQARAAERAARQAAQARQYSPDTDQRTQGGQQSRDSEPPRQRQFTPSPDDRRDSPSGRKHGSSERDNGRQRSDRPRD